ncbi:hypothetical protein NQ317_007074 [Molorchus minor]|uniref:Major facilitator superfamily (MFS) profile domain-containing protein n=1 Tax=Molorchus minor TaxID=1323400 RepID=A0ABQ9K5G7_9CUCU|nr:hypothetical protein NQ317_007074 [Molorchus minor]
MSAKKASPVHSGSMRVYSPIFHIGALGTGTVLGWTSNISDALKRGDLNGFTMDDDMLGWAGSAMTVGALVMCFPIGWIADIFGRKPTVLMTLFITIGILMSGVLGYFLPIYIYHLFCIAVPVVFGVLFLFQSETPTWSIKKNRMDKAEKAYKRLRGNDYNPSEEIKVIQEQIAKEKAGNFWVTMKTKQAKKATLICFALMFYQQLSGINAVIFYSKEIFIASGSSLPSHWCVIIIGVVQVIATVCSTLLIERAGRKILLMGSEGVMALSTFLLGLFFSLKKPPCGPIPWLASSEIFPPEVMAKCSSAAAVFNWFLAFLVTKFYLNVAESVGNDITFYVFAAISLSGVFFILFVMPETRGKTFAEIQADLAIQQLEEEEEEEEEAIEFRDI